MEHFNVSNFNILEGISDLEFKLNKKYSLEEFLKNDFAVPCAKKMNPNVKNYFNSSKIKKLIKYAIEEPEKDDYLKGHKFPYVASEILNCECPFILERLVLSEEEYYKKYKKILDIQKENEQNEEEKDKIEDEENNKEEKKKEFKIIDEHNNEYNNDENKIKDYINKEDNNVEKNNKIQNNNNEIDEKAIIDNNESIEDYFIKEKEIKDNDIIIYEEKEKKENNNELNENKNEKPMENNKSKIEEKENNIRDEKDNEDYIEVVDDLENKIIDKADSISLDEDLNENEQKENSKNTNNEYFDLLLNFIMNDKPELNYVLSGYFAKIINTILNKYPSKVLNYFYEVRPDALQKIIFHSFQNIFSALSAKLLNLENYFGFKGSKHINFRNELIGKYIKSLSLDELKDELNNMHTNYYMESKISFIINIINSNKYVVKYIIESNEIYVHLLNILNIELYKDIDNESFNNKYFIYCLFIDLIVNLLKNVKNLEQFNYPKDFDPNCIKKEIIKLSFNEYMIICFENILKNNFFPKPKLILEPGTSITYEGLGSLNIKIIELVEGMFSFMKEIPNKLDSIIIDKEFFQRSIDYFFKYQWNNIYHLKFIEFFELYLNEENQHKELTKFIFNKYKLTEILINFLKSNNEKQKLNFEFKTGKKIKSGIYVQVIQLMYKLQVIAGLDTFTNEEKKELNILNLGEFEFLKNEKSNKKVNKINISSDIGLILKETKEWEEIIKNTVIPSIKRYEGKLYQKKEEEKKKEEKSPEIEKKTVEKVSSNSNNNNFGIDMLLNFINQGGNMRKKSSNIFSPGGLDMIGNQILMKEMQRSKKKKSHKHKDKNENKKENKNEDENKNKEVKKNTEENTNTIQSNNITNKNNNNGEIKNKTSEELGKQYENKSNSNNSNEKAVEGNKNEIKEEDKKIRDEKNLDKNIKNNKNNKEIKVNIDQIDNRENNGKEENVIKKEDNEKKIEGNENVEIIKNKKDENESENLKGHKNLNKNSGENMPESNLNDKEKEKF